MVTKLLYDPGWTTEVSQLQSETRRTTIISDCNKMSGPPSLLADHPIRGVRDVVVRDAALAEGRGWEADALAVIELP